MRNIIRFLIALAVLASRAGAQPEDLVPLSAPGAGVPLQAPILAPQFGPLSPEGRAAHRLDVWRQAMRVQRPIGAKSWILMDAGSGRVLAAHNADARMFPASTTKTLMALTALSTVGENGLDRTVTIGSNPPKTGEQSINLLQGEKFTLRELLQAALIKSANDACVAVAEGVAGSVPKFVAMMNAEARKVGATHSHFANPHGLHDPDHYTTAHDLALIARAAMKFHFFNETVRTREATIHGNWKLGPTRLLVNRNRLLWRWNECDGAKTGYTKQAGRCLIASATRNVGTVGETSNGARPFRLISVVMHARDSWSDCTQLLLYQGFAKWRPAQVAREGQEFASVAVAGGFSTTAIAPRDFFCAARAGRSLEQRVHLRGLSAPLKKGALVGALDLYDDGRRVARMPLIAQHGVAVSILGIVPVAQLPQNQIWLGAMLAAIVIAVALLIIKRHMRRHSHGRTQTQSRRESRRPQPEAQSETRAESREQFLERLAASRQERHAGSQQHHE